MLQDVSKEFEKTISGADSLEVSTKELSVGAKINRIFHERFPIEIVKVLLLINIILINIIIITVTYYIINRWN